MAELGNVLAVVMAVNIVLWLGQVAALELNPSGPQFYSCEGSMIGQFEANGCTAGSYVLDDTDPTSQVPNQGGTVEVDSGSVFTDSVSATTSWFTQTTGLQYLYNILAAPSNFLKAIGVPDAFAFAVGVMWYGFTLFLIVAFILGRDY